MTKYQSVKLCGAMMILAGICMMFYCSAAFTTLQYTVAFCMLASTVFAIITSFKSRERQAPFKYHELHAFGMGVYGIGILFFPSDVAMFLHITAFFFIYYGMTELIFSFQLLNQKSNLRLHVLIIRLIIGFVIYLGALFILNVAGPDQQMALKGFGVMFILCGINMIFFKTILGKWDSLTRGLLPPHD